MRTGTRRAGRGATAAIAVACLLLTGSRTARAQVRLEYKFPEGRKLTYKTSSNSFQTLTLMGMEIQSGERKTVVWTQTVGPRRSDASLPVAVKVQSLRTALRLQGGIDLTYDSTGPVPKIDDPDLASFADLARLESEVAYTVVLNESKGVKAIEGTEKLLEKAGKLDAIVREQIRDRIEPDRLKARIEQEHRNLPDAPARPGESWERTEVEDYGGQALTFRKKYEYAGTEKRGGKALDRITSKVLEVKCQPDPHTASPLKVTKSDLKVESSEGTTLFDRDAGCVVESRERTRLKGSMTFSGGGTDTAGQITLSLQSTIELQAGAK
jgi:hypothetical protein